MTTYVSPVDEERLAAQGSLEERDRAQRLALVLCALDEAWSPTSFPYAPNPAVLDADDLERRPCRQEIAALLVLCGEASEPYVPVWVRTLGDLYDELDRLEAAA